MATNKPRQSTPGARAAQPESTFEQARDKAEQIADDVRDTAQQAINHVTQNFDLNDQVAQRPWLMFGAAIAAGYMLGNLGGSEKRQEYRYYQPAMIPSFPSAVSYGQYTPTAAIQQAQHYESSQREGMMGKVGRKLF